MRLLISAMYNLSRSLRVTLRTHSAASRVAVGWGGGGPHRIRGNRGNPGNPGNLLNIRNMLDNIEEKNAQITILVFCFLLTHDAENILRLTMPGKMVCR